MSFEYKKYDEGDRIYHKEFFWLGTILDTTGIKDSCIFTHTRIRWDDPLLPKDELVNTEEIEVYDFKGIIRGAIHSARKKGKKN